MLLEEIKGFYHGVTKIFLVVGSYTMLSCQLIKEVLKAVYPHLNIKAQFNFLASYSYVVDKKSMLKWCRDSPINMPKNSPIMQARPFAYFIDLL